MNDGDGDRADDDRVILIRHSRNANGSSRMLSLLTGLLRVDAIRYKRGTKFSTALADSLTTYKTLTRVPMMFYVYSVAFMYIQ